MIVNSSKDLGILVRTKRKQKGWTQKDLAMQVDVSPLWISQFERGKSTVHLGLVIRALKALDVKLWVGSGAEVFPQATAPVVNLDELLEGPRQSMAIHEADPVESNPDRPKP